MADSGATAPGREARSLERLFEEAADALSVLDAEALEALAASAGARVRPPRTAAERRGAGMRRSVLAHLLAGTARRLEMLRRISAPDGPAYGPGSRRPGWPFPAPAGAGGPGPVRGAMVSGKD